MSIDLKKVPNTPGVYKFFNNHEIIYIGKAKNLKKRVSSYFGKSHKDRKTSQIKFLTDKVETFTTKNAANWRNASFGIILSQKIEKSSVSEVIFSQMMWDWNQG